ncbi:MAG: LicD family protein [Selenomonadaceae bacterium]|nr:LicD family protein [Selenomonadaceae bacterium]
MGEGLVTIIELPSDTSNDAGIIPFDQIDGRYIYFIEADGMFVDENALDILVKAAEESDADIVHSTAYVERDGDEMSLVRDQPTLNGLIDDKNIFAAAGFHLLPSLNLYRKDFLERRQLSCRTPNAFSYAAFNLADKIFFINDYFYVKTVSPPAADHDPNDLVADIKHDEFRDGFLVTSQRKKLWNVQLHLIDEFARICRKHDLKWFAYAGTLLGAVRHRGFIPWDDDVDLAMFRPDYERLKKIIADELSPDYALDCWYDYAVEGERNPLNLPTISKAVFDSNSWWPSAAGYFKIRDNRTSMIEYPDRPNVKQGMCIDVFPLDPVPPFSDQRHADEFKFVTDLFLAVGNPQALNINKMPSRERKYFKALIKKPFRDRALEYENFLAAHWFEAEYSAHINSIFAYRRGYEWRTEYWRELVELPFERLRLPAPVDYDKVLAAHYGNWREMYITHSHFADYSADMSSEDYFARIAPEILAQHLNEKEALADG